MSDSAEKLSEIDRLRAFEQRMHVEGAAGFAEGLEPWNEWQETDNSDGQRTWGCDRQSAEATGGKTLCEKLLTTMATLAVATLAVGIGGVYLSAQNSYPLVAQNTIHPEPINAPTTRLTNAPPTGTVIRDTASSNLPAGSDIAGTAPAIASSAAAVDIIAALEPPGTPLAARNPATAMTPTNVTPTRGQAQKQDRTLLADKITALPTPAADITTTLPAPAAGTPRKVPAETVSMVTKPAMVPPASSLVHAAKNVDGIWVVNISSYTYESMARTNLAEFLKKGVKAEIHPVTIKDKPMYRIRATGYDSRREAKTWVSLLEERLGVNSAWVSKR